MRFSEPEKFKNNPGAGLYPAQAVSYGLAKPSVALSF
jgi:hypothetical protein